MNATQKLTQLTNLVQKHYEAIKAQRGQQFITAKDHEEMAREAKRRAFAEIKAA